MDDITIMDDISILYYICIVISPIFHPIHHTMYHPKISPFFHDIPVGIFHESNLL